MNAKRETENKGTERRRKKFNELIHRVDNKIIIMATKALVDGWHIGNMINCCSFCALWE